MVQPTGISGPKVRQTIVGLRAFGEIMGVPGPQLEAILDKARVELEFKPDNPGPPPPAPLLNP